MPEARGDRSRLRVVFLPAMLCDDELYRPQLEGLRDLIDPLGPTLRTPRTASGAWRGGQARPSSYDRTPPSWAELTDERI